MDNFSLETILVRHARNRESIADYCVFSSDPDFEALPTDLEHKLARSNLIGGNKKHNLITQNTVHCTPKEEYASETEL